MTAELIARALREGFDDYARYVNPFIARRAQLGGEPVRVLHAAGGALRDDAGREIEDFNGTQALGHRSAEITRAVRAYLDSDAPAWFPSRVNPFYGHLARRLCERTGYSNVFLAMSGTEAVEAALKLARAATRRPRVLALERAYHGCTFGAAAFMPPGPYRDPFAPHLPGAENLPFGDVDALHRALKSGDVACVIVEPIQLEGGVRVLPRPYIEALCTLTEQHGALLIADEVQTGCGRTGQLLATGDWPRRPDVVTLGKTLGGGIAPCSAMLTHEALFTRAYGGELESAESHNNTFGGNALACIAALATLDVLDDALLARVRDDGERFAGVLRKTLGAGPLFDEVRGRGFVVGVALRDLAHPWLSFEHFGMPDVGDKPTTAPLVCNRLYKSGMHCFVSGHDWRVVRIQPRYAIPFSTLERLAASIAEALAFLSEVDA